MLWIALYLPELSLQIAERGGDGGFPLVISEGTENRPQVFAANPAARGLGVREGMSLAAARALAGEIRTLPRETWRESAATDNIACWASQFTPSIAVEPQQGLLLEVSSTLALHGGLGKLLGRLRQGLCELGYSAASGVAPAPLAAWLFAKARHHGCAIRTCTQLAELDDRLADLPLALFDWPPECLNTLATLGIVRIRDCLRQPRDGFRKRFGKVRLLDLDRARGREPDPRPYFVPPERFSSAVDFGFEANDAMALLFPLKRLLAEMEGFLRGRGAGVHEWHLHLLHSRHHTSLRVGVAAPERSADRHLTLAREHLGRTQLAASVTGIRIEAERFSPLELSSESWLPDAREQGIGWGHLIDKLVSRLGTDKVYRIESRADHRPERAWGRLAAATPATRVAMVPLHPKPRPLWLLPIPRTLLTDNQEPLCQGRLELLAGPERIESGWWDGRPASRDYFVARNPNGETLWIYREHHHAGVWYLHGIFA